MAIQDAAADLLDFFGRAYHLEDAIVADGAFAARKLEAAITAYPDLSLLADIANTDKHQVLNKEPRSGDRPVFVGMSGVTGDGHVAGWELRVEVKHRGTTRNGADLARDAMEAWSTLLSNAGLI